MGKAIMCDRCKKCFDPYSITGEFASIDTFTVRNSESIANNESVYFDEGIDLCPDCLKSWNRWFKNYSDTITAIHSYSDIVVDKESLDKATHIDELRYNLIDQINQLERLFKEKTANPDVVRKNSTSCNEKDGV